jgi:FAD synthetase
MIQDYGEHAAAAAAAAAAHQEKPVLNSCPAKPKCADPPPRSLHDVCLELRGKVDAFLAEKPETPLLRSVQVRLRVSMGVVEDALERYRCVFLLCLHFHLVPTGR